MTHTTDIELIEASDLQIDASVVDVSEVESMEDKDFLQMAGEEILTITAKADFAIKKVVATIQGRANLEKGRVVYEMQRHFGTLDEDGNATFGVNTGGKLPRFFASIGLSQTRAQSYSQAYRTTLKFRDLFDGIVDPEKVLAFSDSALKELNYLPNNVQEQALAEVAAGEDAMSSTEIKELAQQPEVKLSKAEELLARARARKAQTEEKWEEVKADPNIPSRGANGAKTPEYENAQKAASRAKEVESRLERELEELKASVHEEQQRRLEEEERAAKLERELNKLKYDDTTQRAERVKRLSASLTVSVPQVLADLQKFFAERDQYDEQVREHLVEQSTYLTNYIADQLDG